LLGCPNGAVNLRVGKLVPSESSLFITKSTGIEFDPAATAPTWSKFLQRIFRGNPDLIPFVQQLAGYWLTGLTDPPFLSVLYGVGANGKSTLVSALSYAMGEYAMAAPPNLLVTRYGDRHPTELASLQGKRFVIAAETSEGGRLDEERIKALTGSDAILARRMREDFYTFKPTHSFALMTNHKPIVRGVDEGIWRRLLLVPFNEVIPAEERDTGLTDKLRAEAPGILRWAVEGARQFHENNCRLVLPKIVAEATKEYRTESDVLGEFLSDECEQGKLHTLAASVLYLRYVDWCAENGERAMSKKALGLRLQGDGYKPVKDRRGNRSWQGLRLRGAGSIKGQV
jgi:putative DNA primase/helicase